MSDDELENVCKAYLGDCHGHLRNIIVKAMSGGAKAHLEAVLEDDLAQCSSFERKPVSINDLIR